LIFPDYQNSSNSISLCSWVILGWNRDVGSEIDWGKEKKKGIWQQAGIWHEKGKGLSGSIWANEILQAIKQM
jgi:hypothetical protein